MELNNRELASVLLLGSFVAFVAWQATRSADLPRSLLSVGRAFATPAVLVPFVGSACWMALLIRGGQRLGAWDASLVYDTALWVATLAVVAMANVTESLRDRRYVRKIVLRTVEAGILLELVVNLYVLPLPAELVVQFLMVVALSLPAYAKYHIDKYQQVFGFLERVTALVGLSLLAYVAYRLFGGWRDLDGAGLLRSVVLPVWLTVGFAPYLFLLSFFVAYDKFIRGVWRQTRHLRAARVRGIIAALVGFRGSRTVAGSAPLYVAQDVARATDYEEAHRIAVEWRVELSRRAEEGSAIAHSSGR